MPVTIINPYSGDSEPTCSVSFAAQNAAGGGSVSGQQTEAQFAKSQQLGTLGVLQGKAAKGEIASGTKVLEWQTKLGGERGYFTWQDGFLSLTIIKKLKNGKEGKPKKTAATWIQAEQYINSSVFITKIPGGGGPANTKPESKKLDQAYIDDLEKKAASFNLKNNQVVATHANGDQLVYDYIADKFAWNEKSDYGFVTKKKGNDPKTVLGKDWQTWDQVVASGDNAGKPKTTPSAAAPPVATPVSTPPVSTASASVGSMSNEGLATMFVLIKDKLAADKGVNIKGANAALDQEVYAAIGDKTGYTPTEVKAKIDAYKAAGNKLSALKKKAIKNGMPPVTTVHTTPTPTPAAGPTAAPSWPGSSTASVPTAPATSTVNAATATVAATVNANPTIYSDEDIAGAYIIAKDAVVAASNGKWTLYTKDAALDKAIYDAVEAKTGKSADQTKAAVAAYLATGKKLSGLKKQLAKQGAFKPQADTMKSKPAASAATASTTSTPTPAATAAVNSAVASAAPPPATSTATVTAGTGGSPVATPAPTLSDKEKARKAGDISGISEADQEKVFKAFKAFGSGAYLDTPEATLYESFAKVAQGKLGKELNLTKLQVVRIVDAYGASKVGVSNGNLFEKKMVLWLTTPAGKKSVLDAAKKLEEAAKAQALRDNQPDLPADSAQFKVVSKSEMAEWRDNRVPKMTADQKASLKKYTGDSYKTMNGYLRGDLKVHKHERNASRGAIDGMRETDKSWLFHRGCDPRQFGLDKSDVDGIYGLVGKTLEDKAFISTSFGGNAAFGGSVLMEFQAPPGTQGQFVSDFSQYKSENEFLLQAGTRYTILRVEPRSGGVKVIVRIEVDNYRDYSQL